MSTNWDKIILKYLLKHNFVVVNNQMITMDEVRKEGEKLNISSIEAAKMLIGNN